MDHLKTSRKFGRRYGWTSLLNCWMSSWLFWGEEIGYFEFYHGGFVLVHVAVVRRREDGDNHREIPRAIPPVHLKSLSLSLMRSNNTQTLGLFQECLDRRIPKEIRAPPHIIILKGRLRMAIVVIDGIRPHQIAQYALFGNLLKAVDFCDVLQSHQVWWDAAVDAEELPVQDAG